MADDIKKNKAKIKNVAKKELKNQAVKRKIKVEKGGQKKTKYLVHCNISFVIK